MNTPPLAVLSEATIDAWIQRIGAEVVGQLIDSFLTHTPVRLAAARARQRSGDAKGACAQVHLLIGSAGNLGAEQLSRLALRAQDQAQAGDLAALGEVLGQMERSYEELLVRLRAFRESRGA